MLFKEAIKGLKMHLSVERKLAEKSVSTVVSQLNKFGRFLEDNNISLIDVKYRDLSLFITRSGGKEATINARINALKKMFSWLLIMEYVNIDPSVSLKMVKVKNTKADHEKIFSSEEKERLFKLINSNMNNSKTPLRQIAIIDIMFSLGLRVSEVGWIKLKNIDFENGKFSTKRKGGEMQELPLENHVSKSILKYISLERKECGDEELFLTGTGNKFSDGGIQNHIDDLVKLSGNSSLTPHSIRHTCITDLVQKMPVTDVQWIANHKSIETTLRYVTIRKDLVFSNFMNRLK